MATFVTTRAVGGVYDNLVGTAEDDLFLVAASNQLDIYNPSTRLGDRYLGGEGDDTLRLAFDFRGGSLTDALLSPASSIETIDISAAANVASVVIGDASVRQAGERTLQLNYGANDIAVLKLSQVGADCTVVLNGSGQVTLSTALDQAVTIADGANGHVNGNIRADVIRGGSGNDAIKGMLGDDVLSGGAGNDTIYGDEGSDTLSGSGADDGGNDTISGGAGINVIFGGEGEDSITAGEGSDTVSGGLGGDLFTIVSGGSVTIQDLDLRNSLERIDIRAFSAVSGIADLGGRMQQTANGVSVDLGGTTLLLKGKSVADLADGRKFIFSGEDPYTIKVAAGASAQDVQAVLDYFRAQGVTEKVTIELAAGDYYWNKTIEVRSDHVTIVGAGSDATRIHSTISAAETDAKSSAAILVRAAGGARAEVGTFTAASAVDADKITVSAVGTLKVGDVIYVSQANDQAYVIGDQKNQAWVDGRGTEAVYGDPNNTLREALVEVTAVTANASGGYVLTLAHGLPYAFAAGKAKISTTPMVSDVHLEGLSIRTDGAAPDPFDFEDKGTDWTSIPTVWFQDARDSSLEDVAVINAQSHSIELQRSYRVTGDDIHIDGSRNKGGDGNGYGLYFAEAFENHFSNVTILNTRHAVITSSTSAEHYNTVDLVQTNRDINFHGSPDSGNMITVGEMTLDYGPNGSGWHSVSVGTLGLHPLSSPDANTVRFSVMNGGALSDTAVGVDTGSVLNGLGSADKLTGGAGIDHIYGGASVDVLDGKGGDDWLYGDDQLDGHGVASAAPIGTGDTIDGGAGNDTIFAGVGADTIDGGGDDDFIDGGTGADVIDGGAGEDIIVGGLGDDVITTGSGSDRIVRSFGDGTETITDFTPGEGNDVIVLAGMAVSKFADLMILQEGADAVVEFGNDDEIVLRNVKASALTEDNFDFKFPSAAGAPRSFAVSRSEPLVMGTDAADTLSFSGIYLSNKVPVLGGRGYDTGVLGGSFSLIDPRKVAFNGIDALDVRACPIVRMTFNDALVNQADGGTFTLMTGTGTGELTLDVGTPGSGGGVVVDGTRAVTLAGTRDQALAVGDSGGGKVTGGEAKDAVAGGRNADSLSGNGGNDRLMGNGGRDTLDGGSGNDMLDGGADRDKMTGGAGNDTYRVDSSGDRIVELVKGGTDTINSAVSLSLEKLAFVENLVLLDVLSAGGSEAIEATGNAAANTIKGNELANVITGGLGKDKLYAGNDGAADRFVFATVKDSGATASKADHILQFKAAAAADDMTSDKIDLSLLDADPAKGDQALRFVENFVKPKGAQADGQVMVVMKGQDVRVLVDIDGDKTVDMAIVIEKCAPLMQWDFIL